MKAISTGCAPSPGRPGQAARSFPNGASWRGGCATRPSGRDVRRRRPDLTQTVHVVGAGLAGLSAALHASAAGRRVVLYEGAQQAGGRCRTYHDARLGRDIDNGNHLILSGNRSVLALRALAGAPEDTLVTAAEASFPFVDLATGERWRVHMNDGVLPWWPLVAKRRPPGVGLAAMLGAGRILFAREGQTIGALCPSDTATRQRFWEPMAMAVVNLPPETASASLMRATVMEAWRDGRRARPVFAPKGLGPALVDPVLGALEDRGTPVRFGSRLKAVETDGGRARRLVFARGPAAELGAGDSVVLALPPHRLGEIMPELDLPEGSSSILNAHFVPGEAGLLEGLPPLVGLVGSMAQWIFVKDGLVSLTISAAEHVAGTEGREDALLSRLWSETVSALALPSGSRYEAARLVREKRATFLQTPANVRKRPQAQTVLRNLFLAGDFTDTGLPATIEGAVRSGERAARLAV